MTKKHEPVEPQTPEDDWKVAAEQKGVEAKQAEEAAAPYRGTEADRIARISELERELEVLKRPVFQEYPKMLAGGIVVNSADEEATYLPRVTAKDKDEAPAKKHKKEKA